MTRTVALKAGARGARTGDGTPAALERWIAENHLTARVAAWVRQGHEAELHHNPDRRPGRPLTWD